MPSPASVRRLPPDRSALPIAMEENDWIFLTDLFGHHHFDVHCAVHDFFACGSGVFTADVEKGLSTQVFG